MKKIILLLVLLALIGCSEPLNDVLGSSEIDQIKLSTDNHSIKFVNHYEEFKKNEIAERGKDSFGLLNTFDLKDWQEFIDQVNTMTFKKGKLPKDQPAFKIKVLQDNVTKEFYLYSDKMFFIDEDKTYKTDDRYIVDLYKELSSISFPVTSILMKKPIIYLYPQEIMDIDVSIDTLGKITTTYPSYKDGWHVKAYPDGKIVHEGKAYAYLYWEGIVDSLDKIETGFVVKGSETAEFLDDKLSYIGLNYKERNDFITFWLPELESNPYNMIHFMQDTYDDLARLNVNPEPDSLIRVFMVYQGLDRFQEIPSQDLMQHTRNGFVVVDWGGSELIIGEE